MCLTCPNIPNMPSIPSHPTDPVTVHRIVNVPPSPAHAFALFLADVGESTKPIRLRHIRLGPVDGGHSSRGKRTTSVDTTRLSFLLDRSSPIRQPTRAPLGRVILFLPSSP
jgi:hypothetical protein